MKFVVCDADPLLLEMIEAIVSRHDHEVVGAADNAPTAIRLVSATRPDVVIVDLSLGYGTDFDIIGTATDVGARVIVFSHAANLDVLGRYSPRPAVVAKPDLKGLERLITSGLRPGGGSDPDSDDRRRRPARAAQGPVPTGPTDAQAFYEALGNAADGDALLAVEPADVASLVAKLVRGSDRVLDTGSRVMVFLAGGGEEGIDAFVSRVAEDTPDARVRAVVIESDESGTDAFARLKSSDAERHPPV